MFGPPTYISASESGFKGTSLDAYLQQGYYRMQHQLFTTNYTQFHMESYALPVFWLRLDLKKAQILHTEVPEYTNGCLEKISVLKKRSEELTKN